MRITLDDGEGARVLGVLHDKPISTRQLSFSLILLHLLSYSPAQTFLVVSVDLRSLLQLGNQLVDGLLVLLGVEVNDECVDHCCGLCVVRGNWLDESCLCVVEGKVKQLEGGML